MRKLNRVVVFVAAVVAGGCLPAGAGQQVRTVFLAHVDMQADPARRAVADTLIAHVRGRIAAIPGLVFVEPWAGQQGATVTFDRRTGRPVPAQADSLAGANQAEAVIDLKLVFRDSLLSYDCAAVEYGSGVTVDKFSGDLALAGGSTGTFEELDVAIHRVATRLLSEVTPYGYPFAGDEVGLLFLMPESVTCWQTVAELVAGRLAEAGIENARFKTVCEGGPLPGPEVRRAMDLVRAHLTLACLEQGDDRCAAALVLAAAPVSVSASSTPVPLTPRSGPCVEALVQNATHDGARQAADLLAVRALYTAGRFEEAVGLANALLDSGSWSGAQRRWLLFVRAQARHGLVRSWRGSVANDHAALALQDYAACLKDDGQGADSLRSPHVLFNIADVYRASGEHQEAERGFAQAGHEFAADGSWREEILAYAALEELYRAREAWSQARGMCHKIVAVAQRTGDALTMAEASESLGMLFEVEGQPDSAVEAYRRSLEVYRLVGKPYEVAELEGRMGTAFRRLRQADSASVHFARQIALAQELQSEPLLAKGHFNLGLLLRADNRLDSALVHFTVSLEQMRLMGDMAGLARALNNLGAVHHEKGDSVQAARFYTESLKAAEKQGENTLAIRALLNLGDLCRDGQDYAGADGFYNRALDLARANGDLYGEALSLFALGLLRLKSGRIGDGYTLIEKAVRLGESVAPEEFAPQRDFLRRLRALVGEQR
ncbi:MAG: tetratricopeptide repeat protein [Candidatus Oleimicrobiaceae bacterium]